MGYRKVLRMDNLYERLALSEFLKNNKPQINADEHRLNLCALCVLCGEKSIIPAFESSKKDEPCLSILNSILSRHLFNRTYSSHN